MKKLIIIFSSIAFFLIIFFVFLYFTSTSFLLRNTSLSKTEKENLTEHFNKKEISYLLEEDCTSLILKIDQNKEFEKQNLEKYCTYYKQNKEVTEEVIYLVKHNLTNLPYDENMKAFIEDEHAKPENLKRYLEFKKQDAGTTEEIVTLVNHNYDAFSNKNDTMRRLHLEPYFLLNNIDRYQTYLNNHPETSTSMVVSLVNVGMDGTPYTNIQKANLEDGNLILVNKFHKLRENDVPTLSAVTDQYSTQTISLTKEAKSALTRMIDAANKENLSLKAKVGYYNYATQSYTYQDTVRLHGEAYADQHEPRPGHNEHQTGLAIDFVNSKNNDVNRLKDSEEGKWLMENAHFYGFILRYPEGKEAITGFAYNPYHYRYVGIEEATIMKKENLTLEEYLAFYKSK